MGAGEDGGGGDVNVSVFVVLVLLIFVILIFAFVFLIAPDPSPHFILHGVKLYTFNLSTTNSTLTSTLQITISCRNGYHDDAFHFDKLEVYASYRKQQITLPTTIPPSYLGSPDLTIWSPYLNGTDVVLSPDLAMFWGEDVTAGMMLVNVEVTGQLSLKLKFNITRRVRLKVDCPGYIMFGNNDNNVVDWTSVKKPFVKGCRVKVSELKKPVKKSR